MPPKKTPTSSLSVVELLAKMVWYRSLAGIRKIRSEDAPLETSITPTSLATRLPLEVIEMIIACLSYDVCNLRACSLTCYSWYITAVPHLHYNLFITADSPGRKWRWPNPLLYKYMLGLLPLIKTFWVRGTDSNHVFSPKWFNYCTLRHFSALTNVRRLMIDYLDIPSFMPRIRRYFRPFLPTVQELCLREPKGTRRQIIYFIGLFKHLQDLYLLYDKVYPLEEPTDDLTLTPLFTPPLEGWLKLTSFRRVGLLKDLINLFGGIRFRWMDLFDVDGMQLLLRACAKTLKTLLLYPDDPRGEQFLEKDFDLSRNKSLLTLQVTASSLGRVSSSLLKYALSTITSPGSFQVMVLYRLCDFRGVEPRWHSDRPPLRKMSQADKDDEALLHSWRFDVLREAHRVRDFRLVLCADIWDPVGEYAVRTLKEAVAEEKAKKGFDDFFSEPLVTHNPQRSRL